MKKSFDETKLSVKNDIFTMEYPFFALSKKKVVGNFSYKYSNGMYVEIVSGPYGLPTIFDKDILLFCASVITRKVDDSEPTQVVRASASKLLKFIKRGTGGDDYRSLEMAFKRLNTTFITTNIKTNGSLLKHGFTLIKEYKILLSKNQRMEGIEIVLSDWIYNAILARQILTVNPDYFTLTSSIARRIYEIARQKCGVKRGHRITFSFEELHRRSGSFNSIRDFKFKVKKIINDNIIPDYYLHVVDDHVVIHNGTKLKSDPIPESSDIFDS